MVAFAVAAVLVPSRVSAQKTTTKSASAHELELASDPPDLVYSGLPPTLPQDEGVVGLRQNLVRLGTTARLMQVVAHPDDEDGGMLTLESRGHGASVLLMTLTRGEGGQNKIGSNLSDVLGVVRAEELLASDQYYGVQDRFSRVADFGYSKTAEETFEKWGGHDPALSDMVRVIRTFRPDVLIARFSGTDRDGHGNHQASSRLTQEAFHAAADPKRFPEQIAQGLAPWQPKKLFIGNVCGFGAMTCPDADWTVQLNTGQKDSLLGTSYIQFAMTGLRHQLSQGAANWTVDPGDRFTFYRMVDSAMPSTNTGHQKDFFDGIDTSLPGLASRLGAEQSKLPHLREDLTAIAGKIAEAGRAANGNDHSAAASPLAQVVGGLARATDEVEKSNLSASVKQDLLVSLADKLQQSETALNLALNVTLQADAFAAPAAENHLPQESDALTAVSPGDEFSVAVKLHNGSKDPLAIESVKLGVPPGWKTTNDAHQHVAIKPGEDLKVTFRLQVPSDAAYTRPYWHRDDPERDSLNHIDDENYATLPFPPPPLRASVEYTVAGGVQGKSLITTAVVTPFVDESGKERIRSLTVLPRFSVMLEPGTQVVSTHNGTNSTVTVGVTCNCSHAEHGILRLDLPAGWKSEPTQHAVSFSRRGEKQDFQFKVIPAGLQEGYATLRAVLDSNGAQFSEGDTLVTREDLGSFYYFQPARQRVSIVDVMAPHDLKIGYIMGAGDTIPTVLRQIGMNVTEIAPEKLAREDLSQYATIVLGIRAYDTQKDVVAQNKKLLDFVSAAGTLLVQYNTSPGEFNSEHLTPYPADLSRARVSVEEAPIEILAPDDPIFHWPNPISQRDFNGWIQERGLYFMSSWDDHFKPLLACNDPGESPQKGGLLRAQYGKGTYIYTGYAFFRQLPAGVPGAVRLYVNLLSAGHEKQVARSQ